ncbi:hypothetical protein [Paracoccus hibiscisoli]|uniref:Uncharacterized protein n=1 Tax=Paracoccus hibiscisoli TaxID=2023261 RepID=A0A4U0QVK9_9RHOB|nr:hypothetical protein [Paracoccus hibiscisoli]TJZ86165.1 hypothetical protein FA740_04560 [Paracoccus hibiscisoli]
MIRYAILDDQGIVVGLGDALTADDMIGSVPDGHTVTGMGDDEYPVPMAEYLGADEQFHPLPPRPGPWARWQGVEWIDPRTPSDMQAALYAARDATFLDKSDLLTRMFLAGLFDAENVLIASQGEIPPTLEPALQSMPAEAQVIARIKWRSDTVISRVNPVIVLAAAALGVTDEQMDAIFGVTVPA